MRVKLAIPAFVVSALACFQACAEPEDWCDVPPYSPLVVDVKGNGIKLGPRGVGVYFDLHADGSPVHMQWVRARGDEAFLVADLNSNGIVDDGSELFGEGTELVLDGRKAVNGFIALQQYDSPALGGNDDGQISNADTIWPMLRLWNDMNADGKSSRAEMKTPQALGLVAFDTIPRFSKRIDAAGNTMPYFSWVTRLRGPKVLMVDVFFAQIP
jgi:hypothetical protein